MSDDILALLESQPKPVCAALTPFHVLQADPETGFVKVEFDPQPAFENHFGHIQGGFAVSMIDVVVSVSAFVKVQQWLPTLEIKTSFLTPARIATVIGEGRILRAGRTVVFVEASLWNDDHELAVHATATLMRHRT